jgi:hypothetical protein
MMTLKLAVLATTAAGAVAAAGGITYATVGNSSDAPSAQSAKNAAAANAPKKVAPAPATVPSVPSVPTCLPKLPSGKQHAAAVQHGAPANLPKVPGGVPTTLPKAPGGVPTTLPKAPGQLPKMPKLPTCEGGSLPDKPSAGLPGAPGLPPLPTGLPTKVSCASVPPAIKLQHARAKDIALPNGMHLSYAHAHSIVVRSHQFCANTQKFVAVAGGFLTVERLNTPPQVTLAELAGTLKLAKGNVVSVGGVDTWRSPSGDGMLWYSDKGYALFLTGSPAYTPLLPGIAAQLRAQ